MKWVSLPQAALSQLQWELVREMRTRSLLLRPQPTPAADKMLLFWPRSLILIVTELGCWCPWEGIPKWKLGLVTWNLDMALWSTLFPFYSPPGRAPSLLSWVYLAEEGRILFAVAEFLTTSALCFQMMLIWGSSPPPPHGEETGREGVSQDEETQVQDCCSPLPSTMSLSRVPWAHEEIYRFFMEINLGAHLGRELEGSPSGVQEDSTCFPVHAAGWLFPGCGCL